MTIEVRPAVITVNGNEYTATPAVIESTMLGTADHGVMSFSLAVKGDGWGTCVGQYVLDQPPASGERDRRPHASCGLLIQAVLDCVGVSSWEKLPRQHIHVLYAGPDGSNWGKVSAGIVSADLSRALVLADLFAEFAEAHP